MDFDGKKQVPLSAPRSISHEQRSEAGASTEVAAPVFEYKNQGERERAQQILDIPRLYPNVNDAYTALKDNPDFKETKVPAYPGANGASYDKEMKRLVRAADPIKTGYMLHAVGGENFRTIVGSMNTAKRESFFSDILKGDNGAILDELLDEPFQPIEIKETGNLLMDNLRRQEAGRNQRDNPDAVARRSAQIRRDEMTRSLVGILFRPMDDAARLTAIQVGLSRDVVKKPGEEITIADALDYVRESFNQKSALRKKTTK